MIRKGEILVDFFWPIICIYKVNKDCEYPKNESSMNCYLMQNNFIMEMENYI